jgi:hypothetical protein
MKPVRSAESISSASERLKIKESGIGHETLDLVLPGEQFGVTWSVW